MNRIFHNPELERIDIGDDRFYKLREDKYLPSVTTKLDALSKGSFFNEWLMNVGQSSKELLRKAGETGTNVHQMIELAAKGFEIRFLDDEGKQNYTLEEWELFMRWVDWYEKTKPEILALECQIYDEEQNYAGTIDCVYRKNDLVYMIDWKTSNSIYYTYELQQAAYATAWNKFSDVKIDNIAILWLKSSTRADKEENGAPTQGKGWKVHTWNRSIEEGYKAFSHVNALWDDMNPDAKPFLKQYPDRVKIKVS